MTHRAGTGYIQPTIDIIKSNHTTSRVKQIHVPVYYVHEIYVLLAIDPFKLKTTNSASRYRH